MKVTDTYSQPVISGAATSGFEWEASGKMFKMVISGLYSNKAQSITREIWSNAFDAHAMCGKDDTPFEVSLPSRFSPEFIVRDFGEGLSHEWMQTKYVVVGYSSKEDTNLAVGKWGVGRLSPLAYIDTYSVVSIHKGMKAIYNVVMLPDGSPQLNTLVPPMKTDEPSGMQISFPVKPEDLSSFMVAAKRVSLGFSTKPKLLGGDDFTWPVFELGTKGDSYATYTTDLNLYGAVAKMGCVLYPIDLAQLGLSHPEQSLFKQMNILLEVPIGSVEVTASREDLSYGPKEPTKETLSNLLLKISKSVLEDIQKEVSKCDSSYKAFAVLKRSNLPAWIKNKVSYKCELLTAWEAPSIVTYFTSTYGKQKKQTCHSGRFVASTVLVGYKNGPKADQRVETRVRAHVGTLGGGDRVFLCYNWDPQKKVYSNTQEVNDLIDFFGKDLITYVKDIPDVTPTTRAKTQAKVYDWSWSEVTVDMEDGGKYVRSHNNSVCLGYSSRWTASYAILNCVKGAQNLVIVNKSLWKKFEAHPKWQDVTDEIPKEIDSRKEELKKMALAGTASAKKAVPAALAPNCQTIAEIIRLQNLSKRHPDQEKIIRVLGNNGSYSYGELPEQKLIDQLCDELFKKYPLLDYYRSQRNSEYVEYIKAIDNLYS